MDKKLCLYYRKSHCVNPYKCNFDKKIKNIKICKINGEIENTTCYIRKQSRADLVPEPKYYIKNVGGF